MSVFIKNIEKFLGDHKELLNVTQRKQILERAKTIADLNDGLITSEHIKEIFDCSQATNLFMKEIQNQDHVQIFSEGNFKHD